MPDMQLSIAHTTTYRFDAPVAYGLQQVRLTPRTMSGQEVLAWDVAVAGGKHELSYIDHHQNHVDLISFDPGTTEVTISILGRVAVSDNHGIVGNTGGYMPLWMYERPTELTKAGPAIKALVAGIEGEVGTLAWLHSLSNAIHEAVTYETGRSEAGTTAEAAMAAGHGVCQDHSHIFVAACRHAGVPARYVSGYLLMDDRIDQDATHAWAEAFVEGLGWVGFDVANAISPDARYVRIAAGLDYAEAAPVTGTRFGAGSETLTVQVQVQQ